jgi:hypothetical protein
MGIMEEERIMAEGQLRQVGILIFDGVEVLDFCGPFEVFSVSRRPGENSEEQRLFNVRTIAEERRTVRTTGGLLVEPHLAINGYPISDERVERLEDGKEYTVQYFERVRLEYHPENAAPNDVLLGQFGRRIHPADPPVPRPSGPMVQDGFYFPETGHYVGGLFFNFWYTQGGLAQFGYPISEAFPERLEDGKTYTVQYFERARLEAHPENPSPYDVLLGQFGRQILAEGAR